MVTAKRIKCWDDGATPEEKTTSCYHAAYVYKVAGTQYQYSYLERAVPPLEMTLYYLDHPAHAFRRTEKRSAFTPIFLLLFPIVVGAAVTNLLGVK